MSKVFVFFYVTLLSTAWSKTYFIKYFIYENVIFKWIKNIKFKNGMNFD